MSVSLKHITEGFPEEDKQDYRSQNKTLFSELDKVCIVIDDDPTGNQTVYEIPLLANWSLETFIKEFIEDTPVFFVLTNSRSLPKEEVSKIYKEIAENILKASKLTQRQFTIISRSDSTLRGHFPLEPSTLQKNLKLDDAITVFIPVMFEGNRVTVNDMHYIQDDDVLTPVNETPFAQDHSFKYSKGDLKAYIEEKSKGKINSSDVFSFSIETIRSLNVNILAENILEIPPQSYCVFNSLNYYDLDKVSQALLLAEKNGKKIIYRTSSSFVPSFIGQDPQGLLTSEDILDNRNTNGGLIIVGSYVKKSSEQLQKALTLFSKENIVEVEVSKILSEDVSNYMQSLIDSMDYNLKQGNDVIVYTSRTLVTGKNKNSTIEIAGKISKTLVDLVKGITTKPKYLLAKGGITSHDLATKGLGMEKSQVLGQIQPGIPLWEMGVETKFPNLPYIVFPGNVGDEDSLKSIIQKLTN